jgi:hypothetical protein
MLFGLNFGYLFRFRFKSNLHHRRFHGLISAAASVKSDRRKNFVVLYRLFLDFGSGF